MVRISPQEYLGTVEAVPQQTERVVYVQQPTRSLDTTTASPLDDQAFKYIMVIGIVIISIAALKYLLKDN